MSSGPRVELVRAAAEGEGEQQDEERIAAHGKRLGRGRMELREMSTTTATFENVSINPKSSVTLQLRVDGVMMHVVDLPAEVGPIYGLQAHVMSRDKSIVRTMIPWSSVEEIAAWVAGDGTDAQRIALADGIRAGLPR